MAIHPEDIISDEANFAEINGTSIRKGSFAALLANAEIINSEKSSIAEKLAAKNIFLEIMSKMTAIGIHNYISWKNPELQQLMEQAANPKNSHK